MEWLNYHHLHYFWMVAREGSLAAAAAKLRLSPPTLSAQINSLERALGEDLFVKQGRRMVLTDTGTVAYRYAEEIFAIGRELVGTIQGGTSGRPTRFAVGVTQSVPKLIARRILEPVQKLSEPMRLICREEPTERLLADLAVHTLDVVLTDAPQVNSTSLKLFNHFLGETAMAIYGTQTLAAQFRKGFPGSLEGAPFLLPTESSTTRRALEAYFDQIGVRPNFVGEFDDSALLKSFAEGGLGLFAAPLVIQNELRRQYGFHKLGLAQGIKERFYAVTGERKIKQPALVVITDAARERLFRFTAPRKLKE